jgi:hypothetical protein
LFLLIIALVFGLGGLFTAAKWLLIIAVAFVLLGAFTGYRTRG